MACHVDSPKEVPFPPCMSREVGTDRLLGTGKVGLGQKILRLLRMF